MTGSLPLFGEARPERADAASNRRKVLAAAEELFARCDPANVTMDAVAAEAGVGKGTLFRRFGDRASLARAVISEHETKLQDAMIRGEPPLGPGAAPVERLIAFGHGLIDLLETHGDMLLAGETGPRWVRFNSGVYGLYRAHIAMLVREADPSLDDVYLSEALLALFGADLHLYLRRARELPPDRIAAGWEQLVRRMLAV
jgi:AcrR family transcriptional regulator